jgi:uncharacterized protein YndB with AHSA1/START domain
MVKKILLAVGGTIIIVVCSVLVLAMMKPDTVRFERSTVVSAPPAAIYPNLEDFHRFGAWSPWEKLDPNMQRTYEGPPKGVGSSYAWSGNDNVGSGKMTITDTKPNERVTVKLEFLKPMESTNTTVWTLTPENGGTRVSWTMEGPNSFAGKIFSVFADMDALIGKDFESGLANLKRISEAQK